MLDYIKKLIFGAKRPEARPLNLYQYKFIRFCEDRKKMCPLDLSRVHVEEEKGLVSVVLPVYNGGDILAQSIQSVLDQTYENFELIIINDGSADNTLEIATDFASRDGRIRVLTQENKKIPRTLSRGFDEAKGQFLTWTSADNVMDKDFLEKMVAEISAKPSVGMVFANMRLIDAKGKKLRKHGWFEFPFGSSNVIFPQNTYELNTYANNTIGAAFMYRRAAKEILGAYSSYKHTLEDYDYWMRMNSLCGISHTEGTAPVYSYRWHDGSLTAKDKELGITKSRYKLMVLDDFRRDFYMTPLMWYMRSTPQLVEKMEEFKRELQRMGHIILVNEDMDKLFFGDAPSNVCYMSFGGLEPDAPIPADATRVVFDGEGRFDISVSLGNEAQRGKYVFEDMGTMLAFLDAKIKNDLLYRLEGRIEGEKEYNKKLSVILCTHQKGDALEDCIEAICSQTADRKDYELIFVSNDFRNTALKELVLKTAEAYPDLDINYITAPQKGLSFARNTGLWAAKGKCVLYVDDDAIMEKNVVQQTIDAFSNDPDLGVMGGQVLVTVPKSAGELVTPNTLGLWSDLKIEGKEIRYARDYGEFPYGANFAASWQALAQIGGFRTGYGRVGNNFAGGEETLVSFMMEEIGKKVALNPNSRVEHRINPLRFTAEHIEKTAYSGILTQYRLRRDLYAPQDWNDMNVRERAVRAERMAKQCPEGSADRIYYESAAKAFRDVLDMRRNDYDYLVKNKCC